MARKLIKKHASSIVKSLIGRVESLSDLEHKLTKGELRELFVSNILKLFLTSQFSIGSGVIVNRNGDESNQTDIVIYDNRILPPFVQAGSKGVYPAESVIATIEVKSWLRKAELFEAEKAAKDLRERVFNPQFTLYNELKRYKTFYKAIPLCAVIGFYDNGVKELSDEDFGRDWLNRNIEHLFAICLVDRYSWLKVVEPKWRFAACDKRTNEETKRFIAVLLDNVRTLSEVRFRFLTEEKHRDWISAYIRE